MKITKYGRNVINLMAKIFGPELILQLEALIRFGKKIDLKNPKTLSDKICWLEYKRNNPLVIQCSDKYEVRKYVISKGLEEILVPLIGDVYSSVDEIDFEKLPNQFVLKATHGCQMNLICRDIQELDLHKAKKIVAKWFVKGFNRDALEPHYKSIEKRVICEQYLENSDSIIDYKIHCINGEPKFILVCSERTTGLKLNIYDLVWNPIYEICGKHYNSKEIKKPVLLNKMLEISRKLSESFEFVRVDLYEIKGKIYFGELTFTPDGGMLSYYTPAFDLAMGSVLNIAEE